MVRRLRLPLAFVLSTVLVSCYVERIPGQYCTTDADCPATNPMCDRAHNTCVPQGFVPDMDGGVGGDMTPIGCSTSATCPASAPVCSPVQVCSGCGATGMSTECVTYHMATPLCGPSGGCVECLTKDNCDAVHKTCNTTTHACAPCVSNSDCTSGLCNAGICADKATLLYVNNAPSAGCSDTGGSFAMPFCSVQKGLNAAAATGKTVVVFSGTYSENVQAAPSLNGGNDYVATAVGVGAPVIKGTMMGVAALLVSGLAGKQVTLNMDGFVIDDSALADGSDSVDCIGGASNSYGKTLLTLTRSTVKGASGVGLYAQLKCALTIDADLFVGNKSGAIKLDSSDFALTNLLIHDNGTAGASGSPFGGVYLAGVGETGKATMFNLTVVNNVAQPTAIASGVVCAVAPTALANTLVLGNTGPATEVNTTCSPSYSAFVAATGATNEAIPVTGCALSDLLVDPANGDYHPKKGGTRPCTLIDQGTNTGAPDHDLDGRSRPQPASGTDDIGCYEAQ